MKIDTSINIHKSANRCNAVALKALTITQNAVEAFCCHRILKHALK